MFLNYGWLIVSISWYRMYFFYGLVSSCRSQIKRPPCV